MYRIYKCNHCNWEVKCHGQDVATNFANHYEQSHPDIYKELKVLADTIRNARNKFASYQTHTIPEFVR